MLLPLDSNRERFSDNDEIALLASGRSRIMTDAVDVFFRDLVARGHQPTLANIRGTVLFDLLTGQGGEDERWQLGIDNGVITLAESQESVTCTLRADKVFFERLIAGRANALTAVLRGEIECFGDVELLMALQRIFPGPPDRSILPDEEASDEQ